MLGGAVVVWLFPGSGDHTELESSTASCAIDRGEAVEGGEFDRREDERGGGTGGRSLTPLRAGVGDAMVPPPPPPPPAPFLLRCWIGVPHDGPAVPLPIPLPPLPPPPPPLLSSSGIDESLMPPGDRIGIVRSIDDADWSPPPPLDPMADGVSTVKGKATTSGSGSASPPSSASSSSSPPPPGPPLMGEMPTVSSLSADICPSEPETEKGSSLLLGRLLAPRVPPMLPGPR